MSGRAGRILFAPASGPGGSGEYYRCLALARAIVDERPGIDIEFLLHAEARVERDERFTYHALSATPAKAGNEVIELIEQRRPGLAVFDCTGRVAQFRAARRLGVQVAWISNRPRKRLKGFRPRQMRWMNLHVIVDSLSPAPRLHGYERLLLRLFPRVEVELARAVVPRPDDAALAPWEPALPGGGEFAVFVAGGGGYEHAGRPVPELFLEAARRFRRETGMPAVVVMGPQYRGGVDSDPEVSVLASLPTAALGALLGRARLAVIGAGNMLSEQALAAGVPLVVAAVGGRDQPRRVARLAQTGRARAAQLDPASLCRAATAMLREPGRSPAPPGGGKTPAADDVQRLARRLLDCLAVVS
ncbi:glycosyltransferase [Wenzhouxiangella sp. EGI_FJ10305]|uniref:glycosyltransferase n=1 Tax=Wenzhouxiangella sp. EGI_FJ10305 TaxID=3243768 RepID=UPI0035DBC33C